VQQLLGKLIDFSLNELILGQKGIEGINIFLQNSKFGVFENSKSLKTLEFEDIDELIINNKMIKYMAVTH